MSKHLSDASRDVSENIVIIQTGFADQRQMTSVINFFLEEISNVEKNDEFSEDNNWRKTEYKCAFLCNVLTTFRERLDAAGKKVRDNGYAYVWFQNKEVVQILLGNNPDGSKREIREKNPDYVPPVKKVTTGSTFFGSGSGLFGDLSAMSAVSWGDIPELVPEHLISKPDKVTKLPALAELMQIAYTEEQCAMAQLASKESGATSTDFVIRDIPGHIPVIQPAMVKQNVNHGRDGKQWGFVQPDVLLCSRVPIWVRDNPDIIRGHVARFCTYESDTYPIVTFSVNHNQTIACHIKFETSKDAAFAKLMVRKFVLSDGIGQSAELIFDFAPVTETAGSKPAVRAPRAIPAPPPGGAWGGRAPKKPSSTLVREAEARIGGSSGAKSTYAPTVGGRAVSPPRPAAGLPSPVVSPSRNETWTPPTSGRATSPPRSKVDPEGFESVGRRRR